MTIEMGERVDEAVKEAPVQQCHHHWLTRLGPVVREERAIRTLVLASATSPIGS